MSTEYTTTVRFDERGAGPLREAVFDTVRAWEGVETGTLLECPAFVVDGTPFVAVSDDGVVLPCLSEADRERLCVRWSALTVGGGGAVDLDGTVDDEDVADGPWPVVPVGGNDLVLLRPYIRRSYEAARSARVEDVGCRAEK